MSKQIWYKLAGLIVMSLVLINAYLLFKEDSPITKKYYISSVQQAVKATNTEELDKEAILATNEEVRISADITSLTEVSAKRGQLVSSNEELAQYKQNEARKEQERLEIEKEAYEEELDTLEDLLDDIEDETKSSKPTSTIDSEQINDRLNIIFGLELDQQSFPADAIASLGAKIAEVQRQITILDGLITQLDTNDILASPIDGVIGEIIEQGNTITFVIYATEKSIVAYVTEDEWQRVEVEQDAKITVHAGKENEQVIEGIVIEKQAIPAQQSLWVDELIKNKKVDASNTIYEIRMRPYDLMLDYPYGLVVDSTITTKEIVDSYKVKSEWVISQEIPNIGNTHVYTLGYDGKTRLTPILVEFKKKDTLVVPKAKKDKKATDGESVDAGLEDEADLVDENDFDGELEDSRGNLSATEPGDEDDLLDEFDDAGWDEDDSNVEFDDENSSNDGFEDSEWADENSFTDELEDAESSDENSSTDEPVNAESSKSDQPASEEPKTAEQISLINPLKKVKEKQLPLYDVTVFTASFDNHTILLDSKPKNIYAPTFLPLPMKKFQWEKVGKITWQDILLYMRY